ELRAAQQGPDASKQDQRVRRLDDVIIGAELKRSDLFDFPRLGSKHDHRDIRHAADILQDVEPVSAGYRYAQDDDVWVLLVEMLEPGVAISCPHNGAVLPLLREYQRNGINHLRVV